jgi:hypothetical protein
LGFGSIALSAKIAYAADMSPAMRWRCPSCWRQRF